MLLLWFLVSPASPPVSASGLGRPSRFVSSLLSGGPLPKPVPKFMYECFLEDIKLEAHRNRLIPTGPALRFTTFNLRFFRRGSGVVELADSTSEILRVLTSINADIYALQEVPASAVTSFQRQLRGIGYPHAIVAEAPSVHRLSHRGGEQLYVMLASRREFVHSENATLGDGAAAFGAVDIGSNQLVYAYSVHLSVRCAPQARAEQIRRLLEHDSRVVGLSRLPPLVMVLIGGDLQQTTQNDYPPEEWVAIARDLRANNLALTDGVQELFEQSGFQTAGLMASGGQESVLGGPRMTAWNGVIVDKVHYKIIRDQPHALEFQAAYPYYTDASDHLPVITDFTNN